MFDFVTKKPEIYITWLILAVLLISAFLFFAWLFAGRRRKNSPLSSPTLSQRRILMGLCAFIIAMEIYKFIALLRGDGVVSGVIGHGNFPFQLCSMALYFFPFVAFCKDENRLAKFIKPFAFALGIVMGGFTLLYPANVLLIDRPWFAYGFMSARPISLIYHSSMVAFSLYMVQSKIYKPRMKDVWKGITVLLAAAVPAIILNAVVPGADYFLLGKGYGVPLADKLIAIWKPLYIAIMLAVYSAGITIAIVIASLVNRTKKKL